MYKISQQLWEDLVYENMMFEDQGEDITIDHIIDRFKKYKVDKKKAEFLLTALQNRDVLHDDLYLKQREDNIKSEVKALKKDIKSLEKTIDGKNISLRRYYKLFTSEKELKDGSYVVKSKKPSKKVPKDLSDDLNEAVAYIIFSDLHFEEYVKADEVNGFEEYTTEISTERCFTMADNGLKLLKKERMTSNIDTLVFGILGDIITGRIHDELIEGNSLGAADTDHQVKNLLLDIIYKIASEGGLKEMIIPCVRGNHGRTTKKRAYGKMSYQNSRETGIYLAIKDAIEREERFKALDCKFEVIISQSDYTYIEVYGKNIRFTHGDHFNYNNGSGGIAGPALRWLNNVNAAKFAEMTFIGHWHKIHLEIAPEIMVNGAIIGTSPYSMKFGGRRRPPQQIFCIQDKWRGFTMRTHIDVLPDAELLDFYKKNS